MPETEPMLADRHAAKRMLGGIGDTKLYDLLNRGEIEGVYLDSKRMFKVASIKAYVARLTNETPASLTRRNANMKYAPSGEAA